MRNPDKHVIQTNCLLLEMAGIDVRANALLSFKKDMATECAAGRYLSPGIGRGIREEVELGGTDKVGASRRRQYPCEKCPLRPLEVFREFEKQELAFVSKFKKGELAVDKGATVLVEGSHSAHLYTVLSGWGFRYKLMADGAPADPELSACRAT